MYSFSSQPKRRKIFKLKPVLLCFHLSAQIENADFFLRFRLSFTLKRLRALTETTQYGAFSPDSVFTYQHKNWSIFKTMRFQRTPILKPFLKASAFVGVLVRTLVCSKNHWCGQGLNNASWLLSSLSLAPPSSSSPLSLSSAMLILRCHLTNLILHLLSVFPA